MAARGQNGLDGAGMGVVGAVSQVDSASLPPSKQRCPAPSFLPAPPTPTLTSALPLTPSAAPAPALRRVPVTPSAMSLAFPRPPLAWMRKVSQAPCPSPGSLEAFIQGLRSETSCW